MKFVKCGAGLALYTIYAERDSALRNVRKQNIIIIFQHMQTQAADGLCESSALAQHISLTVSHPKLLELTADMHWFRFPVRKTLSQHTFLTKPFYFCQENSLTSADHPSNCQLKKTTSLHREFDPQNDRLAICIIQTHILCLPTSLHICTLLTQTHSNCISLWRRLHSAVDSGQIKHSWPDLLCQTNCSGNNDTRLILVDKSTAFVARTAVKCWQLGFVVWIF